MVIAYRLSPEFRRKQFVEAGEDLPASASMEFDPTMLSAEDREVLAESRTMQHTASCIYLSAEDLIAAEREYRIERSAVVTAERKEALATVEMVLTTYIHLLDEYLAGKDIDPKWMLEVEGKCHQSLDPPVQYHDSPSWPQFAAIQSRAKLLYAKGVYNAESVKIAAREVREQEKATWIAEHGSEFLRHATADGYDCQRRYVTERAALEHPGYTLDFDSLARWRSRSCPSEEAFILAQAEGSRVVWVTKPWYTSEEDLLAHVCFQPCEAVVIESYLGHYTLLQFPAKESTGS